MNLVQDDFIEFLACVTKANEKKGFTFHHDDDKMMQKFHYINILAEHRIAQKRMSECTKLLVNINENPENKVVVTVVNEPKKVEPTPTPAKGKKRARIDPPQDMTHV